MVRRIIYSFDNFAKTYLLLLLLPIDLAWVAGENVTEPRPSDETALQKHVAFFDRNHDGLIYPWETFQGLRAIGIGVTLSTVASTFINVALSQKTRSAHGKFTSLFPIEVENIQRGKHGSDTGVYDSDGRFVPSKFEEIFSKHAHTNSEALTSDEVMEMLNSNREPNDYSGWVGAWTEWKILYSLCKDSKGLLHKNSIRAVYDGSLFQQLEEENKSKKGKA